MGHQSSRERLRGQIEEAYGKLLYTYQTQQEEASLKRSRSNRLSITQIVLTAISSCGVVGVLLGEAEIGAGIASLFAALSLGINLYVRGARLPEGAEAHVRCANRLWVVVQDYISLLTDFDELSDEDIRRQRGALQDRQAEIYAEAPRTSAKAYEIARERLKDGHQSFGPGECDKLLPLGLCNGLGE